MIQKFRISKNKCVSKKQKKKKKTTHPEMKGIRSLSHQRKGEQRWKWWVMFHFWNHLCHSIACLSGSPNSQDRSTCVGIIRCCRVWFYFSSLLWKWKESPSVMSDSLQPHGVLGILQARILEWVAFPFSRGSSQPRNWTRVSCIAGKFFTSWVTRYQSPIIMPLQHISCQNKFETK